MIIRQPQLKAARRHAQRVGQQIGDMLDNGHDGDGDVMENLLTAWARFIDQFGDSDTGDVVARTYVAEGFRRAVSGAHPTLELMILS